VTLLKIEICDCGVHEKLSGREGDAKMRMDDSSVEGGGRGRESGGSKVDESKPESGFAEV
jgi:hypothetical protein